MPAFWFLTLQLLLLGPCVHSEEDPPLENSDLFEGDIIEIDDPDDRNAIVNEKKLWPEGIIPYVIDAGLSSTVSLDLVLEAMWKYGNRTCIRFVPRSASHANYIRIFSGQGCYSKIGKSTSPGVQVVSLGKGCGFLGTVLHELGHTVGFFHEHSRSDRDDWITIFWENIKEDAKSQFVKLRPEKNRLLVPFDYDSIMMYGSYSFSKDKKRLKTMIGKNGRVLKNARENKNLSRSDVDRIRMLYNCKKNPSKFLW